MICSIVSDHQQPCTVCDHVWSACISVTLQGVLMRSSQLQAPPTDLSRAVNLTNGLFVCGDHRDTATLDGALKSGRRAAEAVLAATAALPVSSREAVGTTV